MIGSVCVHWKWSKRETLGDCCRRPDVFYFLKIKQEGNKNGHNYLRRTRIFKVLVSDDARRKSSSSDKRIHSFSFFLNSD